MDRQTSSICLQTGTLKGKGFGILLRNYGKIQAMCSEAAAYISASPRCEACTDLSNIFLLLSQPCLPPSSITFPGISTSLPGISPLFCCPQIPGSFGGAPGGKGNLAVPPVLKPRCRAAGHPQGDGSRQVACLWGISQCPALLAVHFPPLIEFVGLRTSSVLLTFRSHAEC